MSEIKSLNDLEEMVGVEKANAIFTEKFMTMVEKARRYDEIEVAVYDGKGLKEIKKIVEE